MRQQLLTSLLITFYSSVIAQNVGIGTTTPRSPLSFPPVVGQKIALWDDGNSNGDNYGMGIQSGQMQFYTYTSSDNFVFGYGRSNALNERMRIINSGADGMSLNGRIVLRNGTNPVNASFAPGIWLYKADNSALLGFIGAQNNQNLGFFGGPGGWGFTYDAINSRVGIGNNNPNAPLAFAPALGKKITLYPGATGDVGFGVAGNRLQIFSDNPNADIAFGYDASGTFNERFAVKPNGALALMGNTGTPGQVLVSNGSGDAASWSSMNQVLFRQGSTSTINTNFTTAPFPPETNMVITATQNSRVIFNFGIGIYNNCSVGPCYPVWDFEILKDGANVKTVGINSLSTSTRYTNNLSLGPFAIDITPGTYTFSFRGFVAQIGSIGGLASMNMTATATVVPN